MSSAKYHPLEDDTGKLKPDAQAQIANRSHLVEAFHFLLCAGGILTCYFYFGIQQERIVQGKYANGEKFTYTQALVFFLCVANTIFAWVLRPKKDVDTVPTRMYGLCAASYLGAMICSNQALQYLPYPTQVLAKSCKPIPVLVFGVLFAGKKYSWRKYIFILMIVVGVAMFLYKDKKTTTEKQIGIGELLLLLSLTMDGTTTSIQDRINKSYKRSTLSMMFYMNFFSTIYLMIGYVSDSFGCFFVSTTTVTLIFTLIVG
ncbi:UAA transporter family protein [Ancylostoma duodenale]|uniref:UAA transporter family protein n=1 Tax=Ancylostoma duodenale TaxID=51022 RepID=A0A0C2FHW7_9BILA|nr:UAA transporter family protein [Ancylostoma duodenale]